MAVRNVARDCSRPPLFPAISEQGCAGNVGSDEQVSWRGSAWVTAIGVRKEPERARDEYDMLHFSPTAHLWLRVLAPRQYADSAQPWHELRNCPPTKSSASYVYVSTEHVILVGLSGFLYSPALRCFSQCMFITIRCGGYAIVIAPLFVFKSALLGGSLQRPSARRERGSPPAPRSRTVAGQAASRAQVWCAACRARAGK